MQGDTAHRDSSERQRGGQVIVGLLTFCPAPTRRCDAHTPMQLGARLLSLVPWSEKGTITAITLNLTQLIFLRKSFVNINTRLVTKVLADQNRLIKEVQNPCLGQCSKGERARTLPPFR